MAKYTFTFTFDSAWYEAHNNSIISPVKLCVTSIKMKYPSTRILKEDGGILQFTVDCDTDPTEDIKALLSNTLGASNLDTAGTLSCSADSSTPSAPSAPAEPSASAGDDKKDTGSAADIFGGGFKGFDGDSPSTAGSAPEAAPVSHEDCLKDIESLIGCDEFKALAKEVAALAPQLKKDNTKKVFTNRNYLFSINSGYGFTTCVKKFYALLRALGIFEGKKDPEKTVIERKLGRKQEDECNLDTENRRFSANGYEDNIICYDISAWMNDVNSPEFRNFIFTLANHCGKNIFVFKVPFVEPDILENIYANLSDILFMRKVMFQPMDTEDLINFAVNRLSSYGFSIEDGAKDVLGLKINEEKSDGRFYGLNTINKVVNEVIYQKELSNVASGCCDDTCIKQEDLIPLVKNISDHITSAQEMLDSLVGMDAVKESLISIVSQIELAVKNPQFGKPCIHMRFVGNPGTGKTTVARILGKMLKEKGVLRNGSFFEYSGRDFCGMYVGQTAPKTASICRDAYGSVLFIDEAYSLYTGARDSNDYGREALTTLIAEMENHRNDLVVIMAGYADDMDILMQGNAGLESRMPFKINFPNYSKDDLYRIFISMASKNFTVTDGLREVAKEYFDNLPDEFIASKEFSNARFVRNLFERTWGKASIRISISKVEAMELLADDFRQAIADGEFTFIEKKKKVPLGFGG